MTFLLRRDGPNVPLEVQRWQYFLRRRGFEQAGRIDGQFGLKTEDATKFFQVQQGLNASGQLDKPTIEVAASMGYTVLPNGFYDDKMDDAWPPKPTALKTPANGDRNDALGCYEFKQLDIAHRSDADEIVILGSCDGGVADWRKKNIQTIEITQPIFADGFHGRITGHRLVLPLFKALFDRWAELDLLHLIRSFSGDFSPRYKRGKSPGTGGHGMKRSVDVDALSNHAFGSAMDINVAENGWKATPALAPARGCVRQLVEPANEMGFYWGGHFSKSSRDGMHFEFADFDKI